MKTYEEIVDRILKTIDKAIHASSEDAENALVATAVELGWVLGIEPEEIESIYEGEYTKEFVLRRGRESGIL